jgi:hypothetical protein
MPAASGGLGHAKIVKRDLIYREKRPNIQVKESHARGFRGPDTNFRTSVPYSTHYMKIEDVFIEDF